LPNHLKGILENMADELPGFVASAVVLADDGLSVAKLSRDPSIDAETTSAYLGVIVKSNLKAIKLLAGDQVTDDILITTDQHYFLIRHIETKPCFLFLMAKRNEWLGRARLLMKKYEQEVIDALDRKGKYA
jgi:predicted regulator of Ras-like GTPase activity (Roadblock/LC7/MglB family)